MLTIQSMIQIFALPLEIFLKVFYFLQISLTVADRPSFAGTF
jgi:hypothetical protein